MLKHDTDFTLILMSEPNNPDMFTQSGQWHDQTNYLTFEHTLASSMSPLFKDYGVTIRYSGLS